MAELARELLLYGSSEPLPTRQFLRAGPLAMFLESGAIRSIKLASREVVRGVYAAVRDRNWGTLAPHFLTHEVEQGEAAFQVRFTAEHKNAEIDFVWHGIITGNSSGELIFTFDGQARRSFWKNRIGWCVLHPMELAGLPVEVETEHEVLHSRFPLLISPHQPFRDIRRLLYPCPYSYSGTPDALLELRFEGELFEMEDQRNWTDASYKTYCTPLERPYPVEVQVGERIFQRITLRLLEQRANVSLSFVEAAQGVQQQLRVTSEVAGRLPALGFALAPSPAPLSEAEIAALRALKPAHLWVELDLARADWRAILVQAQQERSLLDTLLELSIVCDDEGEELAAFFQELDRQHSEPERLLLFSRASHITTQALLERARAYRQLRETSTWLGGGSRANYAELNRAQLPLEYMDLLAYPINPQVHAFDNLSLIETLQAQEVTATNARLQAQGRPLSVGPLTLKPRFNAVATTSEQRDQQSLPANVDIRQISLFAAGWTVGSLRHLARAGADWLTCYETLGWRGLLQRLEHSEFHAPFPALPGCFFPLYHIFADLADYQRSDLLRVQIPDEHVIEALALRNGQRLLLLIANLTSDLQAFQLILPNMSEPVLRNLDETNVLSAMQQPQLFRQTSSRISLDEEGHLLIQLLPFAIARIEGDLEELSLC